MSTLDPLVIEIQARDLTNAAFKKVAKNARLVSNEMKMIGSTKLNIATAWNKNFEEIGRTVKAVTTGFSKFKMEFLSTMFLGMAMQRAFGGALKGAYATFSKIAEGTDLANNKINQLNAAWEFFKFSLIDALMNSAFFKVLIDGIIAVVDWFGQLGDGDKGLIGAVLIGLWAIGTVSYIGSTLILGLNGINTMLVNAGKEALSLKGLLGKLGGAIAVGVGLVMLADSIKDFKSGKIFDGLLNAVGGTLMEVGGIKMMMGKGGGALLGIGIALKLLEEDKLFSTITATLGLLAAIIAAFIKWSGDQFSNMIGKGFWEAVAKSMSAVGWILKKFGFKDEAKKYFAAAAELRSQSLETFSEDRSFTDYLNTAYSGLRNIGQEMDAWIAKQKNLTNLVVEGGGAGLPQSMYVDMYSSFSQLKLPVALEGPLLEMVSFSSRSQLVLDSTLPPMLDELRIANAKTLESQRVDIIQNNYYQFSQDDAKATIGYNTNNVDLSRTGYGTYSVN